MERLDQAIRKDLDAADALNVYWSFDEVKKNLKAVLSAFYETKHAWVYCKRCKTWGRKKAMEKQCHKDIISINKLVDVSQLKCDNFDEFYSFMEEHGHLVRNKTRFILPKMYSPYGVCREQEPYTYHTQQDFFDTYDKTRQQLKQMPKLQEADREVFFCVNCNLMDECHKEYETELRFFRELCYNFEKIAAMAIQDNVYQTKKLSLLDHSIAYEELYKLEQQNFLKEIHKLKKQRTLDWNEKLEFEQKYSKYLPFQHPIFIKAAYDTTLDKDLLDGYLTEQIEKHEEDHNLPKGSTIEGMCDQIHKQVKERAEIFESKKKPVSVHEPESKGEVSIDTYIEEDYSFDSMSHQATCIDEDQIGKRSAFQQIYDNNQDPKEVERLVKNYKPFKKLKECYYDQKQSAKQNTEKENVNTCFNPENFTARNLLNNRKAKYNIPSSNLMSCHTKVQNSINECKNSEQIR